MDYEYQKSWCEIINLYCLPIAVHDSFFINKNQQFIIWNVVVDCGNYNVIT